MNYLINDEAVYKTAPATPGLLINIDKITKNITLVFFGNEAPKAALSNYSVQGLGP